MNSSGGAFLLSMHNKEKGHSFFFLLPYMRRMVQYNPLTGIVYDAIERYAQHKLDDSNVVSRKAKTENFKKTSLVKAQHSVNANINIRARRSSKKRHETKYDLHQAQIYRVKVIEGYINLMINRNKIFSYFM